MISHDTEDAASTITPLSLSSKPLNLSSKRMVLFPVNDNKKNSGQARGGNHSSLIVFYGWTQYGPCLLHYDSVASFNFRIVERIVNVIMRYHLPSATTYLWQEKPQHDNGSNYGSFCYCNQCNRSSLVWASLLLVGYQWTGTMQCLEILVLWVFPNFFSSSIEALNDTV